jgi:FkbH-like protein
MFVKPFDRDRFSFNMSIELSDLAKRGRRPDPEWPVVRLAVLGDTSTQFLVMALRGAAALRKLRLDVFEADYDQIDLQVFNSGSELHAFEAEYVVIYQSSEKFAQLLYDRPPHEQRFCAQERLSRIEEILGVLGAAAKRKIIVLNYADVDDGVFGNFSNRVEQSLPQQIRRLNAGLAELARCHKNVHVYDLAALQAKRGRDLLFDAKQFYTSKNALSVEATPVVALRCLDMIAANRGDFIKCVILDLDNTLWGGAIGDDGLDKIEIGDLGLGLAFEAMQRWVKQLRNRGIILAVCSKNDEINARLPFEEHPSMVLRMEDIAVFVANWNSKAENIRHIQRVLNISFSSMVFLDDNPVERHTVSDALPEVCVPELPQDPSLYVEFLQGLNLFETVSFTEEDLERTAQYRAEVGRVDAKAQSGSETDFLRSLEMIAVVDGLTGFNLPRIAQLIQRSNQFNLRTRRYSEEEIRSFADDPGWIILAFSLRDKFGDYGLISVVMIELRAEGEAFVDNWLMSCRVLGRGMEKFVANEVLAAVKAAGAVTLVGEYVPTAKNALVKDHFEKLGFSQQDCMWCRGVADYIPFPVEIQRSPECT